MKSAIPLLFALGVVPLLAQNPPAPVAFEVAAIKPSSPDGRPSIQIQGGRVEIRGLGLRVSLGQAYRVRPIYVFGEDWLDTKFDISAKIPDGASEQQVPEMLRALLEERFHVRMHTEPRSMPIYTLTVAKGGLKLKELPPDTPNGTRNEPGTMVMIGQLGAIGAAGSAAGLRNPLVDRTGLTGKYEIPLEAALIFSRNPRNELDDSDAMARMQQAVEPLGLQIGRGQEPVNAIIIDAIDHTPAIN